jgi:hypothetical protein
LRRGERTRFGARSQKVDLGDLERVEQALRDALTLTLSRGERVRVRASLFS